MRILGIDPGYDRCGWAVIEQVGNQVTVIAYDCLTPPKKSDKLERFQLLWQSLAEIFTQYQPEELAIESLYFSRNVSTALPVSEVRGLLFGLAFEKGIPITEYAPNQIKLSVTGYGRADKTQVLTMITKLLGLEKSPKIDDTGDALAVALTHATYCRNQRKL